MRRQAVIFIHGIGEQQDGYSTAIENALREAFPDHVEDVRDSLSKKQRDEISAADPAAPIFREVLWAKITSGPQNELWKRVNRSHNLDMVKLRRFFVEFGGDAVGYQRDGGENIVYNKINDCVQAQIDSLKKEFPNDTFEYTFVTHSLGTIVSSNYLYDQSLIKPSRKGIKATNLFTLGSPIAIWTLRFGGPLNAVHPVQVSRPDGAWINMLDDEDVIGFPLRDLNPQYAAAVDMDYVTEIGGLMSMGNPISHIGYWTDNNAIKPIARKLAIDSLRMTSKVAYKKRAYLKYIENLWNV